ncbi:prepilin peptidase [Lederbergia citrea]|uniref:prepilin peptidase n=1 Tax=Lederbergia citrea TaxID=2833581 RepID=UPI001BC9E0BA|nr:A24 family peptidase [Lederbergia citrea]MBS4202748.1 prepilin peptidase [Lederbergia citrea]
MPYIIFLYALLLGSFYNVVGLRVPLKQSIVKPRSSCPGCKNTLGTRELVPVFSYLFLKGKCRHCNQRISPLYPIMELSNGLLFVFAYIKLGWSVELIIAWLLISLFVIIFVSDVTYMLIPDKVLLVFTGIFLAARVIYPLTPWWDSLAGATVGFSLLLLIAIVSKGGMGGGDIKLFAVLGLVLGTKLILLSFFAATLLGAVTGVIGLAVGVFKKSNPIPFGPYIGLGTLIVYFYHHEIMNWYFSFF